MSLVEFNKRAQEAENKLAALAAQINALSTSYSPSKSDEKQDWEVLYWPAKSRGNFIRLIFEEAGVEYKDNTNMEEIAKHIRSDRFGKQNADEGGYFQCMAVPMIRNNATNFVLGQSMVCMSYLAEKFGLRPVSAEDTAAAQMIASNCSDISSELYGIKDKAEKDRKELFTFIDARFQIWLDILQKPLTSGKNRTFYFDNKCTLADLAVFNVLDGIEELFGDDSFNKYVRETHKILIKHYDTMKNRKSVKGLMNKQKSLFSYAPHYGWQNVRDILRGNDKLLTFKSDEIIPDVIDNEPKDVLNVEYSLMKMKFDLKKMGQVLTPFQVQDAPVSFSFKGCDKNKLYTIILTDPDAKDRKKHEFREWVHHLRINVSGNDLQSGDSIIEYVGSGPPPNTGLHRYVWLVLEQSNGKIDVNKCGQNKLISGGGKGEGRRSWKARKFINDNKLGPLVAGTYYNAEYDDFVPKLYDWLGGKTKSYK